MDTTIESTYARRDDHARKLRMASRENRKLRHREG